MENSTLYSWLKRLAALGAVLALSGCLATMPDEVDRAPKVAGPEAHDYISQARAFGEEGRWQEAQALALKASERASLDRNGRASAGFYLGESGTYLERAGQLDEARSRWQKAADILLQGAGHEGRLDAKAGYGRSYELNTAARYLQQVGQAERAKQVWKEAADTLQQTLAQDGPGESWKFAPSLAQYLYQAGETEAAIQTLLSALPQAQAEWNQALAPDNRFPPYRLNQIEAQLGEALLSVDKARAYAVFERLLSRRDHPYTIDGVGSGVALWQAGKALQDVGDVKLAQRMYMAAAQTIFLDSQASSRLQREANGLADRLRSMGFARDAELVEKRLSEGETLHASEVVKAARARAESREGWGELNTNWERNQLALVELYAQGYEYFGNQRLADVFWRQAQAMGSDIRTQEARYEAEERMRQARQAAAQTKQEEGSGFLEFINVLSAGVQAYASARQSAVVSAGQAKKQGAQAGQQSPQTCRQKFPAVSVESSMNQCRCENSVPVKSERKESYNVSCPSAKDPNSSWGCTYFKDGLIQCSVR